ncbi:MAG: PaaI family thioesterase [Rhizobacter sp.]
MSADVAAATARRNAFAGVPFTRLLGMRREFSEGGRARFVIDARAELENVIGALHGGVVATLLDVAMASAAVSKVDFEMTAVTLSMNSTFIRPGHGRLTADGEVLAVDDAVALCQASVVDEDASLVARALGSFRYLPHR